MKSLELRISEHADLCRRNGKASEVAALLSETPGKFLERKCHELEILARPFMESFREDESNPAVKSMLVESFRAMGLTEQEAKIAAGVERSSKNDNG